ncbi:histidinol-phosphate transaminase [bacterium]|nr:histidinol-phosphate transaminase [bacterium]
MWSPLVQQLEPYTPGEQPQIEGLVKLNTNENPYPPSPAVNKVLAGFDVERLRLYPDPESLQLRETVAQYHQMNAEQIFIGNGSDEVLAHAFKAFFCGKAPIQFPDITYSFYPVYCQLFDIEYKKIPLADDFSVDLTAYGKDSGGIIIANPNAPTGRAMSLADIETLLSNNTESVVIIDEAYVDFGADTAVSLVARHPNLLVIQTLSKSRSLAGLRVGFAIGDAALIDALNRVKNSFNSYPIDMLAQQCAIASLQDEVYFRDTVNRIIQSREVLVTQLGQRGFSCLPSHTNFIFAQRARARHLMQALREKNVLVRYFDKPRIDNFLRITIGTESQHQALLKALDQALTV